MFDFLKKIFKRNKRKEKQGSIEKTKVSNSFKTEGNVIYVDKFLDKNNTNKEEVVKELTPEDYICPSCNKNIYDGRKSNKDQGGNYYICCPNCSYVSMVTKDRVIIKPPNTLKEVRKAYLAFNNQPKSYKMNKEENKIEF